MKTPLKFPFVLFAVFGILIFSSCRKNAAKEDRINAIKGAKNMNATLVNPDIYVAGYADTVNGTIAKYWKNGVEYVLNRNSAKALAIAIDGNDFYIAGNVHDTAVYWKNGVRYNLPKSTDWYSPVVKGIAVINGQVYATGGATSYTTGYVAVYWPPSGGYQILNGGWTGTGIAISGSNVYISGYSQTTGVLWTNGTVTVPTSSYVCNAIKVNGNDVYLAGENTTRKATYWKNGVGTALPPRGPYPDGTCIGTGITISGTDVYVSGYTYAAGASYWKNSTIIPLTQVSYNAIATSIAVNGSDIYVAGYDEESQSNGRWIAKYWKNGAAYTLTYGATSDYAMAIAVK